MVAADLAVGNADSILADATLATVVMVAFGYETISAALNSERR